MFKTALFYDSPKKHQKSVVPKIAAFSAALLLACSCESEGRLPNEKKGKIDLAAFLADKISQYGGSRGIATTNDSRLNNYVYSQDENGFQVLLSGDKVPEVLELFIHSLGQPRLSTTNNNRLASFRYSVAQANVAITVRVGMDPQQKGEFTHIVVVKRDALK